MTDFNSIPEFYAGRTILITGATGFIGKVLIWKLLQSCPLIKRIYILLRAKKGIGVECRLAELLECVVSRPSDVVQLILILFTFLFTTLWVGRYLSILSNHNQGLFFENIGHTNKTWCIFSDFWQFQSIREWENTSKNRSPTRRYPCSKFRIIWGQYRTSHQWSFHSILQCCTTQNGRVLEGRHRSQHGWSSSSTQYNGTDGEFICKFINSD